MYLSTLVFVFLVPLALGLDRKITSKLNPGCKSCNSTLVYIQAKGIHDTIHQIWDFTRSTPTIIFAVGGASFEIDFYWKNSAIIDFKFSEKPLYSFALAVDAIYEYDDIKDEAIFTTNLPHRIYPFGFYQWKLNANSLNDSSMASIQMQSGIQKMGIEQNSIDFKLLLLPYKDYGARLPHLIHTANTTLVDIDMVNFTTYKGFNNSRFAMRFMFVSTDGEFNELSINPRKSLDDEHTPGVFEIIEVQTPSSAKGFGGYVQYRPVAYTSAQRGVETSTVVRTNLLNRSEMPEHTTLSAFYRRMLSKNILVNEYFVSIGDSADRFYKQYNYTSWSFTVGYGSPPIEGFSFFVIMIICFGLGVPVVLALSGVVYVMVKRLRRHNPPRRLLENE